MSLFIIIWTVAEDSQFYLPVKHIIEDRLGRVFIWNITLGTLSPIIIRKLCSGHSLSHPPFRYCRRHTSYHFLLNTFPRNIHLVSSWHETLPRAYSPSSFETQMRTSSFARIYRGQAQSLFEFEITFRKQTKSYPHFNPYLGHTQCHHHLEHY